MRKEIKILLLSSVVLGQVACKHELPADKYMHYVKSADQGLLKRIRVGEWEYDVQYKPADYILYLENAAAGEREKRRQQLDGTVWFNVSVRVDSGRFSPLRFKLTSKEEYEQRYSYFVNNAGRQFVLVYDHKDTLLPIAYHFENNFNLAPQETMVVGFELPKGIKKPEKDMQLAYEDALFKNGIVKTTFNHKDLEQIPNLIF